MFTVWGLGYLFKVQGLRLGVEGLSAVSVVWDDA